MVRNLKMKLDNESRRLGLHMETQTHLQTEMYSYMKEYRRTDCNNDVNPVSTAIRYTSSIREKFIDSSLLVLHQINFHTKLGIFVNTFVTEKVVA